MTFKVERYKDSMAVASTWSYAWSGEGEGIACYGEHKEAAPFFEPVLTVLVADDQPAVRSLLNVFITQLGHRVYLAANGLEAVELARAIKPHVLFIDLRMPVMGGIEAVKSVKKMHPHCRITIMSAYVAEEDKKLAEMMHLVDGILDKPFDLRDIVKKLEEAIAYWRNVADKQ